MLSITHSDAHVCWTEHGITVLNLERDEVLARREFSEKVVQVTASPVANEVNVTLAEKKDPQVICWVPFICAKCSDKYRAAVGRLQFECKHWVCTTCVQEEPLSRCPTCCLALFPHRHVKNGRSETCRTSDNCQSQHEEPHASKRPKTDIDLTEEAGIVNTNVNKVSQPPAICLASGGRGDGIRVQDMETQNPSVYDHLGRPVYSVSLSADTKWLVSGARDGNVRVWNRETGECRQPLLGHTCEVTSVAISVDGRWLASGSCDCSVRVWHRESGRCIQTLEGHTYEVYSVAISVDGKWLVSGSLDESVRVWNRETGDCIKTLQGHTSWVKSVAISGDGKWLVSGSSDKSVRVWDRETGQCIQTLQGHTRDVNSVAISVDGMWLVSVSDDKSVRVWDRETGQCIKTLRGHTHWVLSVAISADGKWVVSGSLDDSVRVWNRETGECIRTISAQTSTVCSVAISLDGRWLAAGKLDGKVCVWPV